ncbi:RNA polymerase sigma factor [Altericroceibacterium xinjiangense]|uniref:RNA polymerase sigma factor n=1 Tax=Altericroceibacterium xinjiangense TaxID=762261 RepID=UPI001F49B7FD|nr:RNA polymerase sigma factor [Altericroceibacterium xinjiangense]
MAGQGAGQKSVQPGEIERALASLPDEQRDAVLLVMVEDHSYPEAADIVGCSIATLATRLVRGRNALLERLGDAL